MVSDSRRHFAEDFVSSDEDKRLAVLAGNYDPGTFRLLEDCGVVAAWRCAEVGAGGGSVAAWLADPVGREGSVVAFDIDISHLDHLSRRSNVEVREHDIVAESIPDADCDLVHARLVIEHLPKPDHLLEMLAAAVQPGGLLVVECTDMLATAAADQSDPRGRRFNEFMAMSFAAVESMSTFDVGFARRLPRLFDALSFDMSQSQLVGRVARGGDSKAAEYAMPVATTLRSIFIDQGRTTAEAIDEYLASLADPDFWFVANNVIAAGADDRFDARGQRANSSRARSADRHARCNAPERAIWRAPVDTSRAVTARCRNKKYATYDVRAKRRVRPEPR